LLATITLSTVLIPGLLKAYALIHLNAAQATLLGSIDPFITALYGYLLYREKITVLKLTGMIIGFIGVFTSLNTTSLVSHLGSSLTTLWPHAAILAAVACSRGGWLMVQLQLQKNRYHPAQLNGIVMTASGLIALTAVQWVEPHSITILPSGPTFYALLAYTILIGNVLAYTLYGYLLKHNNATFISLAGVSMPLFVGLYSWLFLGEEITLRFFMAAIIFLMGLTVFHYDDLKKQRLAALISQSLKVVASHNQ
jgi:drug/metabolite transporter (DMT)-like permease